MQCSSHTLSLRCIVEGLKLSEGLLAVQPHVQLEVSGYLWESASFCFARACLVLKSYGSRAGGVVFRKRKSGRGKKKIDWMETKKKKIMCFGHYCKRRNHSRWKLSSLSK